MYGKIMVIAVSEAEEQVLGQILKIVERGSIYSNSSFLSEFGYSPEGTEDIFEW